MNYINIIDIKISDYEQVICMISDSWYALHGHRTSGGVKPPRGPVAGRALWLEVANKNARNGVGGNSLKWP